MPRWWCTVWPRWQSTWVAAGVLAAVAPFAATAWHFGHGDRHQRLQRCYAVGDWDAVRSLAKDLRAGAGLRPELEFDLDLRLACIYARDHSLPEALQRLEPWRKRTATQPGAFEARVSLVHLMAGDTLGHVAQLARAHELNPQDPARAVEHALAQARFGSVGHAESLLAPTAVAALSPLVHAQRLWAGGLVQLRRREAAAQDALAQALAAWLALAAEPAAWAPLALCACDHAVALHEAGHHQAARERVAQVWPVLEVHATLPLLRMLEPMTCCRCAAPRTPEPEVPMPKRTDLKTILIIGAGPIVIGQACEFDYSGAQACKALREEGYKVVLVNSNPATIMTDPDMADVTYIEPITWQVVEKIIAKERPDAVLPTMGGQTALNCALDLHRHGVLAKYGVEMIGANEHAIEKAEDRMKFKDAMTSIGLDSAKSGIAHSMEEALAVQKRIQADIGGTGFPMVIRPSFTMGGTGGGIAYNPEEFEEICKRGLDLSPTKELLIEESLIGWKEFEMEVVRDRADNCIIVCSIENLDPMGIHTGDSITVAPAQTLTDKEYQLMRNASDRHPARDRRRHRRLQRAVFGQPAERPADRDRDEPARVALARRWRPRPRASRSPRWRPSWPWATRWTSCATTSPAAPRPPASSPASTTSSPRSRALRSRSSPPPTPS
jgi:hypothetical protein